jgi:hypothetical protein
LGRRGRPVGNDFFGVTENECEHQHEDRVNLQEINLKIDLARAERDKLAGKQSNSMMKYDLCIFRYKPSPRMPYTDFTRGEALLLAI